MPVVFVLCVVGAFSITSRVFDIYVMLVFGLIGFILRELKFPMAPMILGLVLGDLLEKNLTRGLVLSGGSLRRSSRARSAPCSPPSPSSPSCGRSPRVNRSVRAAFARRRP